MDSHIAVGAHRPPSGAAGDSRVGRCRRGPLRSRIAASPYYPALTHPVLRRLLPGVALSALGDGMSLLAIAWLALRLSDSAVLVGAAVAAYSLPGALGAAVLGRWMRGRGGAPLALANAFVRAAALGLTAALALAGALAPVSYVALPVHVGVDLHGSASLLGTFWAVFRVGAVAGELAAPFIRRRCPVWPTMTAIVIGWGAALVPLGLLTVAVGAAAVVLGRACSTSTITEADFSVPSA